MPTRRLQKVNKHLQRTFGEILQAEADIPTDVLVTVSRVDTTANLKSTQIWVSVFPLEKGPATLEHLQRQLYDLQGAFNRQLTLRPLPRIILRLDRGAAHAEKINQKFKELD